MTTDIHKSKADNETFCTICESQVGEGSLVATFTFKHYEHGETFMQVCEGCSSRIAGIFGPKSVIGKPYVGKVFHIKNSDWIYAHIGNPRGAQRRMRRGQLPSTAMIIDEKNSLLCITGTDGTVYWIKRSYFYKEATEESVS